MPQIEQLVNQRLADCKQHDENLPQQILVLKRWFILAYA